MRSSIQGGFAWPCPEDQIPSQKGNVVGQISMNFVEHLDMFHLGNSAYDSDVKLSHMESYMKFMQCFTWTLGVQMQRLTRCFLSHRKVTPKLRQEIQIQVTLTFENPSLRTTTTKKDHHLIKTHVAFPLLPLLL